MIVTAVTQTGRKQLIGGNEGLFCYDSTKKCNLDHWFYYTLVMCVCVCFFFPAGTVLRAGAFIEGDELD